MCLWKYQWDFIHNPEGGWFVWEDSEEGAVIIEFPTCTKVELERFRAAYIRGTSVSYTKDKGLGYSATQLELLDGKKYDVIGISISKDVDFWPHTTTPTVRVRNKYAYFDLGNGVELFASEDDYRNKGLKDYFFPDQDTWENQMNSLMQSIISNLKSSNQSELLKELAILPESEAYRFSDKEKDDIYNTLVTIGSSPLLSCIDWQSILKKVAGSSQEATPTTPYSDDDVIESIIQLTGGTEEDIVKFYNTFASGRYEKEGDHEDVFFVYSHSDGKVQLYANSYTTIGTELSKASEMSFEVLSCKKVIMFNIDFKDISNKQLVLRYKTKDLSDFESLFNKLGFDGAQMRRAMTNRLWGALYKTKDYNEFLTLLRYIPERLSYAEKIKFIGILYNESGGNLTKGENDIICALLQSVDNSSDAEKMVQWLRENPEILNKLFSSISDWSADRFSSVAEALLVLYYKQDKDNVITKGKDVNAENLFEWNPLGNTNKFNFDIPESWSGYWSHAKEIRDNAYQISYRVEYDRGKFKVTSIYNTAGVGQRVYTSLFDPLETVSVYFASNNKHIKTGGWTVAMPGVYLAWIINQGTRDANQAMLSIATTAASMAFGIGELRLAIQGSKYIKAGIAGTLLIKGVNDFLLKNELYKDDVRNLLGENFITNYEAFSSIIDIVLLSKQIVTGELEEKVNALATAWEKIDEHNLNQMKVKYSALYELINSEIEKIKSL